MRFQCRLWTVLVVIAFSSIGRADAGAPVVTTLEVTGEKDRAEVNIHGSFVVPTYSINSPSDGKRVKIEVAGAILAKDGVQIRGSTALIGAVTASTTSRGVAVDIKLTRDAVYRARADSGKIQVLFETPSAQQRKQNVGGKVADQTPLVVKQVSIERRNGRERVVVETNRRAPFRVVPGEQGPARLVINGATLESNVGNTIQGDSESVVRSVRVSQEPDRVILEAERSPGFSATAIGEGDRIVWLFSPEDLRSQDELRSVVLAREKAVEVEGDEVAGFFSDLPPMQAAAGRGGGNYTGRRIDLDFKDADIQNILRLLSEVGNVNVVTSDDVGGRVTIRMRNVPWDQALDVILRAKGLGMVRVGNLIRVAPQATLEKEREMAIARKKQQVQLAPLETRLIPSSYAKASDLSGRVKEVLSERGTVSVDQRTNMLVVRDVAENLENAEELVRSLDSQTPQVLIEARVVEATSQFSRDLGIQWGGDISFTSAGGNPTGLAFPYDFNMAGGASSGESPLGGMSPVSGRIPNPNFVVDFPAAAGTGSGGAIGMTFGSVNGNFNLNVRLSAAESSGIIRLVSSPRILTLDNHTARISQGTSIPYAQVSAQGVQTSFMEARLELSVTPHVTSDGAVSIDVNISRNEPDFSRTGARGDPTILRREASTSFLVQDSHTAVIGGIYTRSSGFSLKQVPFFGDIPILGLLFKKTTDRDERNELLIFLTPRIVNREEALRH